jgi:predicted transcriptional regulator
MSSVVITSSKDSRRSDLSKISDKLSMVSGYSRGKSAYSQKRKDGIDEEKQKLMEEAIQKQLLESEKHKKLMKENQQRRK